ncbi:MAG: universal stress protein [Burkholderiales bacterium]|nr:universal stress protein [Burkholderiales bacterium]
MNSLRSILLHLDASPRSAMRLRLARTLAAQHEARVTALYGVTPSFLTLPLAIGDGSAAMVPMLEQIDADHRAAARAAFDRERGSGGAGGELLWAEMGTEPVISGFTAQALFADLLVLGQHDPGDADAAGVPADFVESVLVGSGKPALVVPYAGTFTGIGADVLVAWKPTREAARAVACALPLLQRARSVHVVGWSADAGAATNADQAGRLDLAGYLRLHGVEPKLRYHASAPSDVGVGESLLSLAADVGADLLVMGCYGHSRARELVLGGATRTILRSMTVPVLMAH